MIMQYNEAYNRRFNARNGPIPHPNVWKFIEITQEEFLMVVIRYIGSSIKGHSSDRKKVDLERDIQILQAKNLSDY